MPAKNKRSRPSNTSRRDAAGAGVAAGIRQWYAGKAPILHFGVKFCALTVLLYLVLLMPASKQIVFAATVADARAAGGILNLIGQHNHVDGVTLLSGDKPVITVDAACSGFDFLSFFSAAVLVFPVPFARKLIGVFIGIPLLLGLNLVRIISLYYVGVHYRSVFDIVHHEIWAMILVVASIILYIAWIRWAGTPVRRPLDATA